MCSQLPRLLLLRCLEPRDGNSNRGVVISTAAQHDVRHALDVLFDRSVHVSNHCTTTRKTWIHARARCTDDVKGRGGQRARHTKPRISPSEERSQPDKTTSRSSPASAPYARVFSRSLNPKWLWIASKSISNGFLTLGVHFTTSSAMIAQAGEPRSMTTTFLLTKDVLCPKHIPTQDPAAGQMC